MQHNQQEVNMEKKSFIKGKKVAEQILEILKQEFPTTSDIDSIMCTLELTVAATLSGVFNLDEKEVELFAEHVKYFIRQNKE